MAARLIVHRGTREIGGSCVELAINKTRIILDVGLPLVNGDRQPFDNSTLPGKTIGNLVELGVAPGVPGLFLDGPRPDAILLSHSHLDHAGLLNQTHSDIPIHTSSGTSKMLLAGSVFGRQQSPPRSRLKTLKPGKTLAIGDILVTPFMVDHSAFGSMAFLLEAGGKRILYSGDLRCHGRKPGMLRDLVKHVAGISLDLLLLEGTHLGGDRLKGQNEFGLEEELVKLIRETPALALGSFSPIDVDRLVTYYRACQRAGRILVVDAYAAFVMHLAAKEAAIPRPRREAGIRVFFNQAFERRAIGKIQKLFQADRITLPEILTDPKRHLMVFRPSMVHLDFGGSVPAGTRCFYSYWKGYLEREDWKNVQEQLRSGGGELIPAHTSGHIYVEDLVELARSLNPKTVVPIHTFEPGILGGFLPNARMLRDGEIMQIA